MLGENGGTMTGTIDIIADMDTVAGKASEIGRLGTADAVADMNVLATADIVSDMNALTGISGHITNVSGISSAVNTVSNLSANIISLDGNEANINAVASNNTKFPTVNGRPPTLATPTPSPLLDVRTSK